MTPSFCRLRVLIMLAIALCASNETLAQRGRGFGRGAGMRPDMTVIHTMFANRASIQRSVKMLPDGAEALTESENPKIALLLKQHVPAVEARVLDNKPLPPMTFHPIFVGLINHADQYTMDYEETEHGVKVRYTAETPKAIMLVQEHAQLVSRFIKNGMGEIHAPYALPKVTPLAAEKEPISSRLTYIHPRIVDHGKVVRLPTASQQPRPGTKIVVDITKGGDPSKLNGAVEKIARFVNIYAGAGKSRVEAKIAVVLHGDATFAALDHGAYQREFEVAENPSLPCIAKLREAGVQFFVCGQSLVGKGGHPDDVVADVSVAVSALTSLANLQADGFAYLPMLK